MSIPNMLGALVDDNKIEAESAFKSIIAQKVGSALDLKRVQVANSLVTQHVPQEDDTEGEDI
jgi:hypothetical protein